MVSHLPWLPNSGLVTRLWKLQLPDEVRKLELGNEGTMNIDRLGDDFCGLGNDDKLVRSKHHIFVG